MRDRGELDANGNYQEGEGPQIASDNCYCARCQRLRKVGVYIYWGGCLYIFILFLWWVFMYIYFIIVVGVSIYLF
jgi:hypothetical protein